MLLIHICSHNDLAYAIRSLVENQLDKIDLSKHVNRTMTDIPRLREGLVGAQVILMYVRIYIDGGCGVHKWVWCALVGVVCTGGCGMHMWVWCLQVGVMAIGGCGVHRWV